MGTSIWTPFCLCRKDNSVFHCQKPGIQNSGRIFHNDIHKSAYWILLTRRKVIIDHFLCLATSQYVIISALKASTGQRPQSKQQKNRCVNPMSSMGRCRPDGFRNLISGAWMSNAPNCYNALAGSWFWISSIYSDESWPSKSAFLNSFRASSRRFCLK
jgi:hypothetical protein